MAKLRFYSAEENAFITNYAKSNQPVKEEYLQAFCVQNNRPMNSVIFKIYETRKKLGIKNPKSVKEKNIKANVVRDNSAKMSKGEFKIPVNNWTMTNENGQLYFVVKF